MKYVFIALGGLVAAAILTWIGTVIYTLIASLINPLLRRIGFRNIKRRISNTVLVVIGSLVGTALISGSLTLYSSLDHTFVELADEMVGEADAQIELQHKKVIDEEVSGLNPKEMKEIEELLDIDEVDGTLPVFQYSTTPYKLDNQGEAEINEYGVALLALDFESFHEFGVEPQKNIDKVEGDELIITKTLAKRLELSEGEKVSFKYGPTTFEMKVAKIYENQGLLGGPIMMINHDYFTENLDLTEKVYNQLYVSAKGGVRPKGYKGEDFKKTLEDAIEGYESEEYNLTVLEFKQDVLNGYGLKNLALMFLVFSGFGIFAGILLVINLYSMLAEERRSEMGILRATAFTRWDLIRTFVAEGFVYTLLSSIMGTLTGIGIGYFLISILGGIFESDALGGGDWLKIEFYPNIIWLSVAFVSGFFITISTSIIASYLNSRLNIVSAIRNLPEEKHSKVSKKWIIKIFFQLMLLISSLAMLMMSFGIRDGMEQGRKDDPNGSLGQMSESTFEKNVNVAEAYTLYFGVQAAVFLIAVLLNNFVSKYKKKDISRFTMTVASVFSIFFNLYIGKIDSIKEALKANEGVGIFLATGIFTVISSVIIISQNMDLISRPIGWLVGRIGWLKSIVRLAFRYPSENKKQTSRTLIMFGIIMYLVIFMSIEQTLIEKMMKEDLTNALGGYDVLIQPGGETDKDLLAEMIDKVEQIDDVEKAEPVLQTLVTLPEYQYKDLADMPFFGDPNLIPDHTDDDDFRTYYNAMTPDYLINSNIELGERMDKYDDDEAVWEAVVNDSTKIVLGESFLREGWGQQPVLEVGDKVQIADLFGGEPIEKEIIGAAKVGEGGGEVGFSATAYIITTTDNIEKDLSTEYIDQLSGKTILADYKDSANSTKTTNKIKKELIEYNIGNILSLEQLIENSAMFMNSFINMFSGFLAFSLIVGTSGLAIIITRSVNQRRQQIGMLRSLGFQRSMILTDFLIESTFISSLGILIGTSMAILGSWVAFRTIFDFELDLPWIKILTVCGIVYGASMLFSILPSIKASKMEPVEATNYPE